MLSSNTTTRLLLQHGVVDCVYDKCRVINLNVKVSKGSFGYFDTSGPVIIAISTANEDGSCHTHVRIGIHLVPARVHCPTSPNYTGQSMVCVKL
jgi:hypothetical protein